MYEKFVLQQKNRTNSVTRDGGSPKIENFALRGIWNPLTHPLYRDIIYERSPSFYKSLLTFRNELKTRMSKKKSNNDRKFPPRAPTTENFFPSIPVISFLFFLFSKHIRIICKGKLFHISSFSSFLCFIFGCLFDKYFILYFVSSFFIQTNLIIMFVMNVFDFCFMISIILKRHKKRKQKQNLCAGKVFLI